MTNTNSPTYAQVTEIMRAAFEERGAPQWRAYLDDLRSTLKDDAGNEDCIAGSLFSEFWLAVARGDHGSAAAIGYVDSAWLQDARHPSDVANLETAKILANTIIDGWEHINLFSRRRGAQGGPMSQLTLQDCITSKTRKAGDQIGRVMAVLEEALAAARLDYLATIEAGDDGITRAITRAKLTQAQYSLDLAKSAL